MDFLPVRHSDMCPSVVGTVGFLRSGSQSLLPEKGEPGNEKRNFLEACLDQTRFNCK